MQRPELYNLKFAKLFHDGGGDNTFFHPQFCEISEREDIVNDFFERLPVRSQLIKFSSCISGERKGMYISGIDSLEELWDCIIIIELEASERRGG